MSGSGKLLVFTAPSGSGKTTIVRHILSVFPNTTFSVSATTRERRPYEVDGQDYYFLSEETFKRWVSFKAFAEWEEVYPGQFYGTLKSEIDRIHQNGSHVVFDVDVKGAMNIKEQYPQQTLTVFIKVPSLEILEERLRARGTDSEENLQRRIEKARFELTFEPNFDAVLINDNLDHALQQAEDIVRKFIH